LFGGGHAHRAVVRKRNLPHQRRVGKVAVAGGVAVAIADGRQAGGGIVAKGGGSEDGGLRIEDGQSIPAQEVAVGVGEGDAVHLRESKPPCLGYGAILI
jgi:hypothetical protein